MHSMYVDNLIVQGESRAEVDAVLAEARECFSDAGVDLHPTEAACQHMTCLGVDHHGRPPTVSMTNSRYWRIWHAIDLVLSRGSASGRDIESLIGHITFGFLVRRPLLSSLRCLYDFSHDRSRSSL